MLILLVSTEVQRSSKIHTLVYFILAAYINTTEILALMEEIFTEVVFINIRSEVLLLYIDIIVY